MGAKSATLSLKIVGDARDGKRALSDFDDAVGRTDSKVSGFGDKIGAAGKIFGGVLVAGVVAGGAALLDFGKKAFDAASEAQQAAGAVDAVFGQTAARMKSYAGQAAEAKGLSAAVYNQLASVLGAQLSNAGKKGDQLAGTVDQLIGLGADLAAQFGGSTADAVEALSSLFKGEFDPIERYGVSIKQSTINTLLASRGQAKLAGSALQAATAQAALDLVMKQTTSAHGAFARESDTAAGALQRLSAMWDNAKASIGERLLPVVTRAANWVKDHVVPAFAGLTEEGGFLYESWQRLHDLWDRFVRPALQRISEVVTAYLVPAFRDILQPVMAAMERGWARLVAKFQEHRDVIGQWWQTLKPALEWLKEHAPEIGRILGEALDKAITAMGAMMDASAWLWKRFADLRDAEVAVVDWLVRMFDWFVRLPVVSAGLRRAVEWLTVAFHAAEEASAALRAGFAVFWSWGMRNIAMLGTFYEKLQDIRRLLTGAFRVFSPLGSLFGAPAAPAAAPRPLGAAPGGGGRLFGAGSSSLGGGAASGPALIAAQGGPSTVVNITIQGAIDPVATGRQVAAALRQYGVATGGQLALSLGGRLG